MFHKTKLNKAVITAIAAGMAASAGSLVMAAGIEEVIVTATKRAENMQDVAIAISALGGDSLKELGVHTCDE